MAGVISGQAQMLFTTMPPSLPHVWAGKLRVLSISHAKRSPLLPDVPTTAEAGLPGFDDSLWAGMLAPGATSGTIVQRVNADVQKVLDTPGVRERIGNLGGEIVDGPPDVFKRFIEAEIKRWTAVIKPQMRVN